MPCYSFPYLDIWDYIPYNRPRIQIGYMAIVLERLVLLSLIAGIIGAFTYKNKRHLLTMVPVSCVSFFVVWVLIQQVVKVVSI